MVYDAFFVCGSMLLAKKESRPEVNSHNH